MDEITIEQRNKKKIVVIGAGPVGALAALYAAQRGHDVEVYELRGDLRNPSTKPLNFTRSINLALSERGINALRNSHRTELITKILGETVPMKGRMVHGRSQSGTTYEESQNYDVHGKVIYSIDRCTLNSRLLDELASLSNVKLLFNHKLIGLDLDSQKAKLEIISNSTTCSLEKKIKNQEVEVSFDLVIGADGAHSVTRQFMMKQMCMDFSQFYVDTLWCEFTIKPMYSSSQNQSLKPEFRISPHHLHIWPGKEYMFIAIPSSSREFVCTLFAPSYVYQDISRSSDALLEFFNENFPGVTPELIPITSLIQSFTNNPHLPLISVKCSPHHFKHSAVILGDATHAMVPFYGQGMNAGLEDVNVLFEILDKYTTSSGISIACQTNALREYSALRTVDSQAISQLAMENYAEMRSSVTSKMYKSRKWIEEKLSLWFPKLGWATKYSRVSFGNERYSEVIKRNEQQDAVIVRIFLGFGIVGFSGISFGIWKVKKLLDSSF